MNYVEEQTSELEALSEIYYNEIEVVSNKQPISFSINVKPQASSYEEPIAEDEDESANESDSESSDVQNEDVDRQPSVDLLFELPQNYPDVKPSITVQGSNNLDQEELLELLEDVDRKAEESLGNVMIFILVSDIVEWLSSKAEREAYAIEHEKSKKLEALEAEEKRKCEGTPVNVETFLAWKAKFDAELLKAKIEEQKKLVAEQGSGNQKRLTGREMFETDGALAESDLNFVEDLEQEQIEALMKNIDDVDLNDDEEDDEFQPYEDLSDEGDIVSSDSEHCG